jgi:beta-glucosidase
LDDDDFGVRWTGFVTPDQPGDYQLGVITTCKVNLYLNDSLIVNTSYHFRDEFGDPRLRKSKLIRFEKGKKYNLRVEAGESYADAQVQLVWSKPLSNPNENLKKQAIEVAQKAEVVIMVMGLSARLEGEEMDVLIEGFRGGDRTTLELPKVQQELIKEIHALGKPVVLVLLSGSALAVNWENQNIPAIIQAWYPGQAAGTAIADVLFGDYNPAGRLPVTFYKSVDDLPKFEDYNVEGHTYRYFREEPLYPFGYGLSYTSFTYENLRIENSVKAGDSVRLSVDVKNSGDLDGEEVVQVYVSCSDAAVPVPIRTLKAFRRISLHKGETKTLNFVLAPDSFAVFNENGEKQTLPGLFEISVGGGQPDMKVQSSSNVLKVNLNLR